MHLVAPCTIALAARYFKKSKDGKETKIDGKPTIDAGETVVVRVPAKDDKSGIYMAWIDVSSPNGDFGTSFSHDEQNKELYYEYTVPVHSVPGNFQISGTRVRDRAGNERAYKDVISVPIRRAQAKSIELKVAESKPSTPPQPVVESNVQKLIRELGDSEFKTREEASEALRKLGASVEKELQSAAKDPDLEIATRAKRLLERIQYERDLPKRLEEEERRAREKRKERREQKKPMPVPPPAVPRAQPPPPVL